ncbi:TFIIB-type zinc ribbon-containing protein [Rarobacter incanus]|uniref:TFIIB-type zinc ribbon-containing protein n=1 Tax=Rarobacter incanus TaxID=153494 RepID=A0A542SP30_9MICO|nr:TFIIB-type zinc ribbon-containing protein [Rarobacter incanus]TQK76380.1 hypothetical protein FB389_1050 [Rarobacter incanus]
MSVPLQVGGHDKCPTCGSTDIAYSQQKGVLICRYCRAQWTERNIEAALGYDTEISALTGMHVARGAGAIDPNAADVVTIKCQGCGAEVVINSATNVQARCHWCRSVLSLNQRVANGAVPDAVLPFSLSHDQAVELVNQFAKKRMFFAHKGFKREFSAANVVGVYMPYLVADVNAHVEMAGEGEVQTRRYTVSTGENSSETRYDADVYRVARDFDITVDDLTVESSGQRAGMSRAQDTANVINAVLPFDTKKAVEYNANYLGGYTSEKRDLDVQDVGWRVGSMVFGIGTSLMRRTLTKYDRGVKWTGGKVKVKGARYLSMYAPIWLYSYYERRGSGKEFLHYIAVNGRTGAVMGSVPINKAKLGFFSAAVTLVTLIGGGVVFFL